MDPVFRTIVILCFCVLFASAGAHKLRSRALFRDQLEAYGLVPGPLVGIAALTLALMELGLAAALLLPSAATAALYGSAGLLILYGLVMKLALWRGDANIDCGCSGAQGSTSISNGLVLRNLVLSAVAIVAAMPGPQDTLARDLSWLDIGLCGLVAATSIAFYQAANQLMANRAPLKMWRTA